MEVSNNDQIEPENGAPTIDQDGVSSDERIDPRPLPAPDVRRLDVDKVLERSIPWALGI